MTTNERKKTLCEANKDLLELIWRLGKGIMYKKQIEGYIEHFFKQKPEDTWEKVKELEEDDIVQRVKLHNIVAIKLKKYALRFILGVGREEIRSIEVTASKLIRTAYVNAVILHHLNEIAMLSKLDYKAFFDRYVPFTTFFSIRNQSHAVLARLKEKGILDDETDKEINRLKEIQKKSASFEKKSENQEGVAAEEKAEYSFNLNSMEQGSVFIDYTTKKEGIHIAIVDDKTHLTGGTIAEKMVRTYAYFHNFVPTNTQFKFTVYVRNEKRLEALKNKSNTKAYIDFIETKSLKQNLTWHYQNCELDYVNLDLDKQLFGNQSLVLTHSVHSKKEKEFQEELVKS